jgi:hypothetical protein
LPRLALALLVAAVAAVTAVPAAAQTFVFHLDGAQEVPPVPSTATGGCMGVLDQIGQTFTLTCVHDVVGPTVVHLHRAAAGANGDIAFDLGDPASPVTATWAAMTSADITELLDGDIYLNIHTAGRPSGEIRGQVLPRTVDVVPFTLDGNQVVPPNGSPSTGACTADLDGPATGLAFACTHDVASPDSAHVHVAPLGEEGPAAFTFASPTSPLGAMMPMTPLLVANFAATFLYLDVHAAGPGGGEEGSDEIRGQVGTPPGAPTTGTVHIAKRTFPPGGTGFTYSEDLPGGAPGALGDGGSATFASIAPGTYTVTEDLAAGWSLSDVSCDDLDSTGDSASRTATIRLAAGEVVTCTFESIEAPSPTDDLFVFHLSGDQEVPPVGSAGSGGCHAAFDSGTSELDVVCVHDVAAPTLMHVHRGAPGVNGDALFDLGDPESPVTATWVMAPADVAELFTGNLYVNIHTAGRPSGEIRGQLLERTVDTVAFDLSGGEVVPPNGTAATGTGTADLSDDATSLQVQLTHDLATPDLAHVHAAPAGAVGPVVFTFPSAASPVAAAVPLTPRQVAEYAATFLYVDVHGPAGSEEVPSDEIRGQLGDPPTLPTTGTVRITKRSIPAGGAGFTFTDDLPGGPPAPWPLADGDTTIFNAVPPGTYTVTESDPAGLGFTASDVSCDDVDSAGNPFARTASVQLQAGETVTCTFTNFATTNAGELYVFHLSPEQEVPPLAGPEHGGCAARLIGDTLSILCTHDVAEATIMHLHRGAPGENGGIVFDLGSPQSPVQAEWTGMTPADVADLRAGLFYVNIHTGGRPAGAIRGQVLPRTVDHVAFLLSGDQEVPPNASTATGTCEANLSDDGSLLALECLHDLAGVTHAHVHSAPPGVDGPPVLTFDGSSPIDVELPTTMRVLADFAAGFLYVNLHTVEAPDGEIRGQIVAGGATLAIPTLGGMGALLLGLALAAVALRRLTGAAG